MEAIKPQVKRRLYTLYPEQIAKIEHLSRTLGESQSQILRTLIDEKYLLEFMKRFHEKEFI